MATVDPTNPQTWNRYAYVANNPTAWIDLLGLEEAPDICPFWVDMNCLWWSPGLSGSGPSGIGGGIGGGVDQAVNAAKQGAVNALNDPGCAQAVAGGSPRAAATLGGPGNAEPLATFATPNDLGPGSGIETRGTEQYAVFNNARIPLSTQGPPVTMTVNTNAVLGFMNGYVAGYALMASQEIGMLHDTGHAATLNGLQSVVVWDPADPTLPPGAANPLSLMNNENIGNACLPQGDFGGNQGPSGGPVVIPAIQQRKLP
jgi:hypothetical protein